MKSLLWCRRKQVKGYVISLGAKKWAEALLYDAMVQILFWSGL